MPLLPLTKDRLAVPVQGGVSQVDAVALRFYVHHTHKHFGEMLFEWILSRAREMGIHGGSAFCATAGFGRRGVIEEQRFIELPADLPILVEFIVSESEADQFVDLLRQNKVHAFCTRTRTKVLLFDGA